MRPYRRSLRPIRHVKVNFERGLIRFMVLVSVLLVVVQIGLGLARDPVDFYMAMAQKVESPPLEVLPTATWTITFKATPAAPIRVLQKGKLLGTLTRGELEVKAQAGTLQLDGTTCPQIVRVQVKGLDSQLHEPRLDQSFLVEKNVQNIRVSP